MPMNGERVRFALGGILLLLLVAACAGPSATPSATPSPSTSGVIATAEQAVVVAERLTSISGPWKVGDVQHGTYESLFRGSTNDMSGQGTAARAAIAARIIWRVDLSGPSGLEELYIDETNGQLLDAITQGN
jgi:hypothetical protein